MKIGSTPVGGDGAPAGGGGSGATRAAEALVAERVCIEIDNRQRGQQQQQQFIPRPRCGQRAQDMELVGTRDQVEEWRCRNCKATFQATIKGRSHNFKRHRNFDCTHPLSGSRSAPR